MSPVARDQLERILYLLPAAARKGGVALVDLVTALGVDENTILQDIGQVTSREFYYPAGATDTITVTITRGRVHVIGHFQRPVRLTQREALAVQLGLRALAFECEPERARLLHALAARIERELVTPEIDTVQAMREMPAAYSGVLEEPELEYDPFAEREIMLGMSDDVLRGVLSDAIGENRVVLLQYLKSGAFAPESRRLAPQQLAYADGTWYLLGYDLERRAPRIFRLDRILDAAAEEPVSEPAAADRSWIERVAEQRAAYIAEADAPARVRYSPKVARWVAERTSAPLEPDGSVLVEHRVADPRWIVRHVLQYAGDAWVEEPEGLRGLVAASALHLADQA